MSKMDDAVVFSKKYDFDFPQALTKPVIETLMTRLIQDIGRPLSHKGIILGHIKMVAKLPDTEFVFLSLTRLDQVDIKLSAQWARELTSTWKTIHLDINVLLFGQRTEVLEEVVAGSLAILRRDSSCQE
ncbi:hypothetical protein [Sporomusa aerivorans]|uniref:hypothetical protein n=1 Tax=Sporomusa aerivorans TaxID=204936 RepID=UPI00352AC17C